MTDSILWEHDDILVSDIVTVPQWIDSDLTCYDIASISQGVRQRRLYARCHLLQCNAGHVRA